MEPLHQFLGTRPKRSYISRCDPRDQLILCYILANSLLYLYPGFWSRKSWESDMIHFIRRSPSSLLPKLTFPFLSVSMQRPEEAVAPATNPSDHKHPAILALGIILLEVASGISFTRNRDPDLWQRRIEDIRLARKLLGRLERPRGRDRRTRVSSNLCKAIRACVDLVPPPNFPVEDLTEEGPIRHFVLVCIVHPLAIELEIGHKEDLGRLHQILWSDHEQESSDDEDTQGSVSGVPSVSFEIEHDLEDTSVETLKHSSGSRMLAKTPVIVPSFPAIASYGSRRPTARKHIKEARVSHYRFGSELVDEHR
jgi:hypothetical protein